MVGIILSFLIVVSAARVLRYYLFRLWWLLCLDNGFCAAMLDDLGVVIQLSSAFYRALYEFDLTSDVKLVSVVVWFPVVSCSGARSRGWFRI